MRRKKKLPKVGGWGFPVWVGLACMGGASLYWWVSCGWGFPVWAGILVGGMSLCGWGFPVWARPVCVLGGTGLLLRWGFRPVLSSIDQEPKNICGSFPPGTKTSLDSARHPHLAVPLPSPHRRHLETATGSPVATNPQVPVPAALWICILPPARNAVCW